MVNIFVLGFQAGTDVLASFPRCDMLLRSFYDGTVISLGFLDRTAIPAKFPVWDSCLCEVSMMVKIYSRGFQDGMDIPALFRVWDELLRSFQNGTDILVRSGRCRHHCEFPMTGQFSLRGVQDGRFGEVSTLGQILLGGSQNETDFLSSFTRKDRRSAMFTRYRPL
jgi:hypothetical protein